MVFNNISGSLEILFCSYSNTKELYTRCTSTWCEIVWSSHWISHTVVLNYIQADKLNSSGLYPVAHVTYVFSWTSFPGDLDCFFAGLLLSRLVMMVLRKVLESIFNLLPKNITSETPRKKNILYHHFLFLQSISYDFFIWSKVSTLFM